MGCKQSHDYTCVNCKEPLKLPSADEMRLHDRAFLKDYSLRLTSDQMAYMESYVIAIDLYIGVLRDMIANELNKHKKVGGTHGQVYLDLNRVWVTSDHPAYKILSDLYSSPANAREGFEPYRYPVTKYFSRSKYRLEHSNQRGYGAFGTALATTYAKVEREIISTFEGLGYTVKFLYGEIYIDW